MLHPCPVSNGRAPTTAAPTVSLPRPPGRPWYQLAALPGQLAGLVLLMLTVAGGCTSISVAPSCPSELELGESGSVWANEQNPGGIPSYKWEVLPAGAGTFADSAKANTSFHAEQPGDAVLRLTASDGLFQVVGECRLTIQGVSGVAVSLSVDPDPIVIGGTAILFCASVGETQAVTRTLEQTDGDTVTLSPISEGVATFIPDQIGDLSFSCTGESEAGDRGPPSTVSVSVVAAADGNANDNTNDNGDRDPPRSGRGGGSSP